MIFVFGLLAHQLIDVSKRDDSMIVNLIWRAQKSVVLTYASLDDPLITATADAARERGVKVMRLTPQNTTDGMGHVVVDCKWDWAGSPHWDLQRYGEHAAVAFCGPHQSKHWQNAVAQLPPVKQLPN